jgi:drug/metabolite transporter (DMT)-like permease
MVARVEASEEPVAPATATGPAMASFSPVPLVALGAIAIAFSAILVRLSEAEPSTAAVFRGAAAVPLLALLAARERRRRPRRSPGERRLAFAAGALLGTELIVWHHSIDDVGAGLATVLANLQVVFVTLVAWAALGERPSRRVLVALPVVVGGALLISGALEEGAYGSDPAAGAVLGVLAGATYGAFILLFRRTGRDGALAQPLLDVSIAAALAALALGAALGEIDLLPGWGPAGWLVLYAVSSQVVAFMLIGAALPRLPAAIGSILLLVQPAGSVALGVAILGEAPTALQLAGVALLLSGVAAAAGAAPRRE